MTTITGVTVYHYDGGLTSWEGPYEPFVTHGGALIINLCDPNMIGGQVVVDAFAPGEWKHAEVQYTRSV